MAGALAPELRPRLQLEAVLFAGEALDPQRLRTWLHHHPGSPRLLNLYGTTETTVHASLRELLADDADNTGSPIGGPLAHLGFFVLDGGCVRCPPVWWGSCTSRVMLWALGIGVGRG